MGRAARWYAARGLRVHPLRPGTKLPLLSRWQERASLDLEIVTDWWRRWPDAGIGIATGPASGVIVVDVDAQHGGDHTYAALEREHGKTPATWRCLTPSGGVHLYVRHPGGTIAIRAGLWPGIDLRADGGYVCAAPTVLADRRGYVWEHGHAPHELAPIAAPAWLLSALGKTTTARTARTADHWQRLIADGASEGRRNHDVAKLAGYLLRRHVDPHAALELVRAWNASRCRPPLADGELVRTVDSIARRELARRGARS